MGPGGIQRTQPSASMTTSPARYVALAAVVVLAGVGGFVGWRSYGHAARAESLESIAVLPFANMSGDPGQEPFADGISEEILNALAQVEGLSVAARTSAFAFKKTDTDVRDIARKLGVASVLEGSVRKQGDRLRITAQLINAGNGYHMWSETFDRGAHDIFAVQDEIARAIVDALKIKLSGARRPEVTRGGTASLSAHELYLLGLNHFARRTGPDMERAIQFFTRAIEEDTSYALAYAGLAQVYAAASFYIDISVAESARLGRAAAMNALARDSTIAEAYGALGDILYHNEWDLHGSERMLKRALALKPSYAQAYDWLTEPLFAMGRFADAMTAATRALELDPLGLRANSTYTFLLYQSGNYDSALVRLQQALQTDSANRVLQVYLIDVNLLMGRVPEAAAALRRFAAPIGAEARPLDLAARALLDPSLTPAALAALDNLEPGSWIYTRRLIAHLYLRLGDRERALSYLERMYAAHDGSMPFVVHDRALAALRNEPRYHALAKKLGITPPPVL
jgi:adenylate cyclase